MEHLVAIRNLHPALFYTGMESMHGPTLLKGIEVLDHLKNRNGKVLSRVWGYDRNVNNKEHHSGRALDFMVPGDRASGDIIADYIIQHKDRLGLIHILWYKRIYRGPRSTSTNTKGIWVPMADRGSPTENHMDHPHAFFHPDAEYKPLPSDQNYILGC